MPAQKDLKRLVRSRMKKTGEAYTAARLRVLRKQEPTANYAEAAGMRDRARAVEMPHREIAQFVSSLGTPGWWTQMVTVGYERIRGLREKGQRRDGLYESGKSRTFNVPRREAPGALSRWSIRSCRTSRRPMRSRRHGPSTWIDLRSFLP